MKVRLLLAATLLSLSADAAAAEDLGGFFSHLFGGPPQAQPAAPPDAAPRPTGTTAHKAHKKSASREIHEAREPSAPIAPSTPPATASKFVYVLGDSLAISAADGMVGDLQAHPEIGVVDRARDASGLVRDDYFDWPKAAKDLMALKEPTPKDPKAAKPEKPKVDVVVIMLGINDKQPLRDGKDFVDPLTDRWKAAYAQRVAALVAPLHAAHVPVIWVGLPPMRGDRFNPQLIDDLNKIFKDSAEQAGAKFVDVFDGFADQTGGYDPLGPNVDGQKARLRGPDGIHMTAAGGAKLAHFIDVEVLAALGPSEAAPSQDIAALPPELGKAADDINEEIRREMGGPGVAAVAPSEKRAEPEPPKPPKPEAGAIASLAARPTSAGAALVTPAANVSGEAERLLRAGEPPRAAPGRADDFTR